jgi:2',3'-cyclic-nucleotide 2'-phosphodiesterase (5'-nucleotidase family)
MKTAIYKSAIILSLFAIALSCTQKRKAISTVFTKTRMEKSDADTAIHNTIYKYQSQLGTIMNEVVGYSEVAMVKDLPEGNLGNFVSDLLLDFGRAKFNNDTVAVNFTMLNNGGLRSSLPQGNITVGNIFELMPFDNQLVCVKLSGKAMLEMFQYIANRGGMPVAGFRMKMTRDKKVESVFFDNKKFDDSKNYYVMTSDYLLSGGDNMSFFKDPERVLKLDETLRDVIINYCRAQYKKGVKFNPTKDGRVSFSE